MSFVKRANLAYKSKSTNYLKPEKEEAIENKFKKDHQPKDDKNRKGPYASIPQKHYRSTKEEKVVRSEGEYIIEEEIEGREISPGQIYDFNLGIEEFLTRLHQVREDNKPSTPKKIQIIDNYYLYQYIHSIKDGIPTSYSEKEISNRWIPDRQVYQRKIKRIYDHRGQVTDLDSYQEYHLIVRIIRFQLSGKIFEIIIPRHNQQPYQVPDKFFDLLIDQNMKILNFPPKTNFMIRYRTC